MKRKALGRGLRSLIPETPPPAVMASIAARLSDSPFRSLDTDRIIPNRQQPRREFSEESLEALAQSLKSNGVLQPVVVRPSEAGAGMYELVAGERRWRAAQMAGLLKLPAIVRDVADDRLLETALVENLQREGLNPVDEALAYQVLADEFGLTQDEVAERVGKKRATVANALRLLNLPPEVQSRIRSGEISAGHAKALVSLANSAAQIAIAERIAREDLSVRATETLVRRAPSQTPELAPKRQPDPNVLAAQDSLQRALGTKVRIVRGRGRAGRLELHFYSEEELERLYGMLIGRAQP